MSAPSKGAGARPDARLIPLLNHLAKLLAAEHARLALSDDSSSSPRKEGS